MAILFELRKLRKAVAWLSVLVVFCTAVVLTALCYPRLVVGLIVLLEIILIVCLGAALIGTAAGKAVGRISDKKNLNDHVPGDAE